MLQRKDRECKVVSSGKFPLKVTLGEICTSKKLNCGDTVTLSNEDKFPERD